MPDDFYLKTHLELISTPFSISFLLKGVKKMYLHWKFLQFNYLKYDFSGRVEGGGQNIFA